MSKAVQPLPPAHDATALSLACDRVGAGHLTASGRWGTMTLGRAQQILRDSCVELLALRSESREMICAKCLMIWTREQLMQTLVTPKSVRTTSETVMYQIGHCPKCGGLLKARAIVVEAALRQQIEELEERVERLQHSLTAILDLDISPAPE